MDSDILKFLIVLLVGAGGVVAFIFFLLTQQRLLAAVRPQDRLVRPGRVWLQLIPVFGLIYQFFVTACIAGSLRKERISRLTDNLMTEHGELPLPPSGRPTLAIGLSFCISNLFFAILNFLNAFLNVDRRPGHIPAAIQIIAVLFLLFTVISLTTWIIYWVTLTSLRRRLILSATPIS